MFELLRAESEDSPFPFCTSLSMDEKEQILLLVPSEPQPFDINSVEYRGELAIWA